MDRDRIDEIVEESRLLLKNHRDGLYCFVCRPGLRRSPPVITACVPRLRRDCLSCFFHAGRVLYDYYYRDRNAGEARW